ncbi:MAG: hypothetical protein Q8M27_03420 [Methylotenera sp.]|nr:hypothetical protein [Methylotenera sp.]
MTALNSNNPFERNQCLPPRMEKARAIPELDTGMAVVLRKSNTFS